MTKMTDEDVDFELSQALSASRAGKVRAHIAALTKERDEAQTRAGLLGADLDRERMVVLHLKESLRATGGERDMRILERNTLRERVKALEAERDAMDKERNEAAFRMEAAESRLAAIRQRADDEDALLSEYDASANVRVGLRAVAHFILGDDAPALEAQPCGMCPGCTDENWADGDLCEEPRSRAATPEPSTAEAFATVDKAIDDLETYELYNDNEVDPVSDEAKDAVAELKRRMGAMGQALELARQGFANLVEFDIVHGEHRRETEGLRDTMADALTDVPDVFTREEVEQVLRGVINDRMGGKEPTEDMEWTYRHLSARLNALHKK